MTATDNGMENGYQRPRSTTKVLLVDVTPINDAPTYALSQSRISLREDRDFTGRELGVGTWRQSTISLREFDLQ